MNPIAELISTTTAMRLATCNKHGDFTTHLLPGPRKEWSGCPECREQRAREYDERQAREEQAQRQRRRLLALQGAGIAPRFTEKTLKNFWEQTPEHTEALRVARTFAEQFPADGRCLILCGKPGTGKTHLAVGIAHEVMKRRRTVRVLTAHGVIVRLRDTWRKNSQESERDVYNDLCGADLLIVDEVGASLGGDAERAQPFTLFNTRYDYLKPTIVISNLDFEGLTAALGPSVIDRLRENGGVALTFTGTSWRGHI